MADAIQIMRSILVFLLSFLLVPVLAAPVDKPKQAQAHVEHKVGDFVGVRPNAYEEKTIDNKRVTIHPGVVLSGPHPVTGKYEVAMISKKLPHDPPQAPVGQFHPGSSAYGNVSLGPAKQVSLQHLKPWKDENTGQRQEPMTPGNVQKLKAAMADLGSSTTRWLEATSAPTCSGCSSEAGIPNGVPSARVVLLKQVDARGFVFFTNYTSRKSQEIIANPHAALVFYWREIHKSVRVVGRVEKITREESDEYFQSRPLGSRLGAWASKQSSVIPEDAIEARLHRVSDRFGENVPTPEFWGGWRVVPDEIEFWCGKPSRLHDRIRYLRIEGSPDEHPAWKIERLSP
ncbi:hypothetical protein NLJ89_g7500 [Agrocybe chaxingu]|uniref:pyridoxal 5'-phosphate synthase n=1 Tax=Agrocybe chaxingu TaxID=84603 RepID=A0A9W8JX36_9AGAR|nr:hypothetical protein NLJ89_g7500 [Agrocybe chaxingu]